MVSHPDSENVLCLTFLYVNVISSDMYEIRNKVAKDTFEANLSLSPQRAQLQSYNGDQCPTIRLMMVVQAH